MLYTISKPVLCFTRLKSSFLSLLFVCFFLEPSNGLSSRQKIAFSTPPFFAFNRDQKASKAARDICAVYGEDAIAERTAWDWLSRFKHNNFDLNDVPRSRRPVEMDEDQLKDLLKEDGRQTCRELAEKINCNFATISRHLQSMGFAQKLGAWVPHELTQKQNKRLSIAAQNLARHFSSPVMIMYKNRCLWPYVPWCRARF